MRIEMRQLLISMCLALCLAAWTGSAWALTASNTQIVNNASLSYNDGVTTRTVPATPVIVTVTLVPGKPNITNGGDQTTPYTGSNTPLINTFYVYAANTNGPDTYTLSVAISAHNNDGTPAASAAITAVDGAAFANPVSIGATVTLTGSTTTVLQVPSDSVADSTVNGIKVNDWIIVNNNTANARQVTAVSDNATGISTITVGGGGFPAIDVGWLVSQRRTVSVTVQSGAINTAGQSIVVTKTLTATSTTLGTETITSGGITDTFTSGLATLTKYVRNVTQNTMTGTGAPSPIPATCSTASFYASGIKAKPGDTLEYMLVANNSGTGAVSAAVISDALPVTYVALQTNVYSSNTKDIAYCNESNAMAYYSAASDLDQAAFATPTLSVNVGTGATNAAGGNIASGATVRAFYQVKVNP